MPAQTTITLNAPRVVLERAVFAARDGDAEATAYLVDLVARALGEPND